MRIFLTAASLDMVTMVAISNVDYTPYMDPEGGTSGHDRTSLCAADVRFSADRSVPGTQQAL